jgi:hypothetical protein
MMDDFWAFIWALVVIVGGFALFLFTMRLLLWMVEVFCYWGW